MIYVDELKAWDSVGHHKGCAMFAAGSVGSDELHAMAVSLGLDRSYFHDGAYALISGRRAQAVEFGAIEVSGEAAMRLRRP